MKNVDMWQAWRILVASLAVVTVWGCATQVTAPPDWISGDAILTDEEFVAYGAAPTEPAALERATDDAVAQVSQIMVRNLESQGVAVTGTVGAAIEELAERRVAEWEPARRFQRRDDQGRVEQYLLYEYLHEDRGQDISEVIETTEIGGQSRRESEVTEFAQQDDGSGAPLRELRRHMTGSVPESTEDQRERLEEIRRRAEAVRVAAEPRRQTVPLGAPAASSVTLTVRNDEDDEGLPDIPYRVQFRGPLVDGRRSTSEIIVHTARDGTASIPVPTPSLSGTTQIVAEPAWLAAAESAWHAVLDDPGLRDLLSSSVERVRARAVVEVTSRAATIPTAIIVLDRDIAGNPIGSADTMRGMVQEFMDTDFRIHEVDLSAPERRRLAEADAVSVADLYDILPFEVVSQTERVIVGDAHIVEFSEEDGFTVVVEVDAGAFDLRRDQVLARVSLRERISGSDARSAIRTAFQAAGRRLVRQIVPRLP